MRYLVLLSVLFLTGCASLNAAQPVILDEGQSQFVSALSADPQTIANHNSLFIASSYYFDSVYIWPVSMSDLDGVFMKMGVKTQDLKMTAEFTVLADEKLQIDIKEADGSQRTAVLEKPKRTGTHEYLIKGTYTKPAQLPILINSRLDASKG